MSFSHVVYVDEAGDEGFGKLQQPDRGGQSQWLLLGAMIVSGTNDLRLPGWRDDILRRFPKAKRRDLHFRNFKHEQKVVVCQEIARLPLHACIVFSNKKTIANNCQWTETFKRPGYLYNYLTRWLLERVTAFCASDAKSFKLPNCKVKVVFSRRGGTNYQSMADYLHLMKEGREINRPVRSIDWQVFNPTDIAVENHSKRAGLQFSDAFTSAFFAAVEPNCYGNCEPHYADILRRSVIRKRGSALNVGVTPVPSLMSSHCNAHQTAFFKSFMK